MSARTMTLLTGFLLLFLQHSAMAEVVIEDDGVSVSYDELEYMVSQSTPEMQQAAATDEGDRLELLNQVLLIKKLAREADNIPPGTDAYWRLYAKIISEKRNFVVQEYVASLKVPDMSDLAVERYETEKETYALVPEKRTSSHILFSCPPGQCSREETQIKAQKVLDELRAGADFVAMVQAHSGDPGTKAKDGKFDKWMMQGEPGVAGPYSEGLFTIAKQGDYSELVSSQFGIHILRLDGVQEKHFLPYDEVKAKIIQDLETEYKKLSLKDFTSKLNMTKDAVINDAAVEKIISPYKTKSQ